MKAKEANRRIKKKKNKQEENETIDLSDEIVIGLKEKPKNKKRAEKKSAPKKKKYKNKQEEERAKKKKKRILKLVKWLTILGILAGTVIFFLLSPLFNILEIKVVENQKITSEKIINMSGIVVNENAFKIDIKQAIANILQEPYIEKVEIKRVLPSTIEIQVKERQATFMLEFANGYVYINNQGYMLESAEEKLEIPIITGYVTPVENIVPGNRLQTEDLKKMETVLKIMETAKSNEIEKMITKIDISDEKNYTLILEGEGKTAYLGDASNINTRIQYLKLVIEKEQGKRGEVFINKDVNTDGAIFREEV